MGADFESINFALYLKRVLVWCLLVIDMPESAFKQETKNVTVCISEVDILLLYWVREFFHSMGEDSLSLAPDNK
jgi:hypothetical protein